MSNVRLSEKFAISKFKELKEPYRKWYYLHSKYVGIAALDIDPKLNKEIMAISGWLHDTAKVDNNKDHARASAKIADKLLKGKIDGKKLKIILNCISNHSRKSKPKTINGKIFQDADKLATFYPEVRRFVKKIDGGEKLKETLKDHYSAIKSKKAKELAKKLLKK